MKELRYVQFETESNSMRQIYRHSAERFILREVSYVSVRIIASIRPSGLNLT